MWRELGRLLGLRGAYHWLRRQGAWAWFLQDYFAFRRLARQQPARFDLRWQDAYPCLDDRTSTTGFDRHYIYHTAWAARQVARSRPAEHVDISSSLYFSALVSAFVPVRFYDYRPADLRLSQLHSGPADLTRLPFPSRSLPSLSCMHVVEHIGLGRYGDPIDPGADLHAMEELQRVLAPGGQLLFVVPVGRPRIQFNAHRIYAYRQVVSAFSELRLAEFTLIPDDPAAGLIEAATPAQADAQRYGCGCFLFER